MAKKNKQAPAVKKAVAPTPADPVTQVDPTLVVPEAVSPEVQEVAESYLDALEAAAAAHVPNMSHNSSYIVWPSDPYGITKDLKVAITRLGSRVGGHADKRQTTLETLAVGIAYLTAKFAEEKRIHDERFAAAVETVEAEVETE